MQITDALKNLYKRVTGESSASTDGQIAELIQKLADNWPAGGGYTLPAATSNALGGVKKASAVDFNTSGATAETCAAAIKAIIDGLKESGAME